jgi:FAD/FMN-containing dehydrogenase
MQGVRVEPAAKRAYLEAGSLLGQLDRETAAFGLATTAGTVSHTGAAGLTLGGGFGRLGRRFGLACDNAASFDVVTADGRFLRASDRENPDLLWGLRGGGGNFGVVTSIEYRVHAMNPVILGGNLVWPISLARDVMRHYRDITPQAPEVLHLEFGLMRTPDEPVCYIEACWSGDHAEGERWLAPLRTFGKPLSDSIRAMPYVQIQTSYDELLANGQYNYAKSGFLAQLDDAGIDRILDMYQRVPVEFLLFFDPCDGAYRRVAPDATAFPNRGVMYWMGMVAVWPTPEGVQERIAQLRAGWRDVQPLTQGFYTNMSDIDMSLAGYRENYGANLDRLVALKARFDPMNLFRLNANVPPKL